MLRTKIIINTFINSSGKLVSFLLQLLIITYLVRAIGKESYGVVVLALALAGNMNLFESGFGLSVTKYVAEYNAKGDWKRLNEIVNTNFVVVVVIAFFFCGILIIFNEFFVGKFFNIPNNLIEDTKILIRILILQALVEFWSVNLMRIGEGLQKFAVVRGIEVVKWILRAVMTIFAVESGYGLAGIGFAYFASGIVTVCILHISIYLKNSNLKFNIKSISIKSFKLLSSFSLWIFLSKAFAFISYRMNTFIIGIFLPPQNLAYYNIAFKAYEVLKYGLSVISSALVPVTSEIHTSAAKEKLSLLFMRSTYYSVVFIVPFLVFYIFYADLIIRLWMGNNFHIAVVMSQLFAGSVFFLTLVSSGSEMLVGMDRLKALIKYNALGSCVNLIVSLVLVRKIGVYGVVVGTFIGTLVLCIGYLWQMLREFSMTLLDFLKKIMVLPILLTTVLVLINFIFKEVHIGITATILYFLCIFFIGIEKKDKEIFLKVFNLNGKGRSKWFRKN